MSYQYTGQLFCTVLLARMLPSTEKLKVNQLRLRRHHLKYDIMDTEGKTANLRLMQAIGDNVNTSQA